MFRKLMVMALCLTMAFDVCFAAKKVMANLVRMNEEFDTN